MPLTTLAWAFVSLGSVSVVWALAPDAKKPSVMATHETAQKKRLLKKDRICSLPLRSGTSSKTRPPRGANHRECDGLERTAPPEQVQPTPPRGAVSSASHPPGRRLPESGPAGGKSGSSGRLYGRITFF